MPNKSSPCCGAFQGKPYNINFSCCRGECKCHSSQEKDWGQKFCERFCNPEFILRLNSKRKLVVNLNALHEISDFTRDTIKERELALIERILGEMPKNWKFKHGLEEADVAVEEGTGIMRYVGEEAREASDARNYALKEIRTLLTSIQKELKQ